MSRSFPALATALAVCIFPAVGGVAKAQDSAPVSRPFTLKIGAFAPSDEDTRNFSGSTHFLMDATYEFGRVPDSSVLYGVYLDYIFESSATTGGFVVDGEGNAIPTDITDRASAYGVGFEARYLFPQYGGGYGHRRQESARPYVGGGLGFYGAMGKETYDEFDDGESRTTTGLGGKVMLGVQSHSGFLGEISYHFVPTVTIPGGDQLSQSGYGFQVGYRF